MFAEIRLRTGADLSGITILRSVSALAFDSKMGDVGSISFNMPLADAVALGVDANSVVEVAPNGLTVPNMWFGLDSSQYSQTQDGASLRALSGKSIINWLTDGIVYPSTWHFATTPSDYAVTTNGTRTSIVPRLYVVVANSVSISVSGNTINTPAAHGLVVGNLIQLATVVNGAPLVANRTYYVKSVPSSTSFTVSATPTGATLIITSNGSGTSLTKTVASSDTSQTTISGHAFQDATPGFILRTLIARCVERGGMKWLDVSSFTGTTATSNNPWSTTLTTTYTNGTTVLQVLQDLADRNLIEYRMDANSLKVYNVGESIKFWTPDQVTFRRGQQITEQTRTLDASGTVDTVLIAGDALAIGEMHDTGVTQVLGRRREKFVTQGGITDVPTLVTLMGGAELSLSGHILTEDSLGIADNAILPWANFQVGDWVWADFDGTLKNIQIQQISATTQDALNLQIGLTLGDIIDSHDAKVQRLLDNITGQNAGSYGGLPNQDTGRPPSDPSSVIATATAYRDANGLDESQVTITWTQPTTNIDGTTLNDLNRYELQYRLGTSLIWTDSANIPASNAIIAGFISALPSGQAFVCRVRAVNNAGHASNWATSNTISSLPKMIVVPVTPSTPVATPSFSGLTATWDGLDNVSNPMDVTFAKCNVYVSQSNTFTPSSSTLVGSFGTNGGKLTISNLTYGNTYFVKLVIVDKSGNMSLPSAVSAGVTPTQVTSADISANSIDTTKIQDGIVTGAKIASGTVTGSNLAANTITTNNLTVAAFGSSVAPNGSFEESTTQPTVDTSGAAGWRFLSYPGSATASTEALNNNPLNSSAGNNSISITIPAGANGAVIGMSTPVPTAMGDVWFVTFRVNASVAMSGVFSAFASLGSTITEALALAHTVNGTNIAGALAEPQNGMSINATALDVSTSWYSYEVAFTVPNNPSGDAYKYLSLHLGVPLVSSLPSDLTLLLDTVSLRPVGGSATITNITASKITSGVISASTSIIAGTANAARLEISGAGLNGFDANNNSTVVFDNTTGSLSLLKGSLSGSISSSTIGSSTVVNSVINSSIFAMNSDGGFISHYTSPPTTTQVLLSGTSWTAPAGVNSIFVRAIGAGAGGSGGSDGTQKFTGNAGGAGEFAGDTVPVTPGTAYTYGIGQGGAGGVGDTNTPTSSASFAAQTQAANSRAGKLGGNTFFNGDSGISVVAHGGGSTAGLRTLNSSGGTGSTNALHFDGGRGGSAPSGQSQGPGGGGSAGSGAAGSQGTVPTGGIGGGGSLSGQRGGFGGNLNSNGASAANPTANAGLTALLTSGGAGGGSAGSRTTTGKGFNGGDGSNGLIIITYTSSLPVPLASWSSIATTDTIGNTIPYGVRIPKSAGGYDQDWHIVGNSSEPAYTNSWQAYGGGYYTARFYKDALGYVHLTGVVKFGDIGNTKAIFTLPAGYRPASQLLYHQGASGGFIHVEINNAGQVLAVETIAGGSSTYLTLDNIIFLAEQ